MQKADKDLPRHLHREKEKNQTSKCQTLGN